MAEATNAASTGIQQNPYWQMDSRSPDWVWYPEVLALYPPMDEWTAQNLKDAEYSQISEWRKRHPWTEEDAVPWDEAKRRLAERLERMDDPRAGEVLQELFADR